MAKAPKAGQVVMPKKIPVKVLSAPAQGVKDPGQDVKRPESMNRQWQISDIRTETDVVKAIRRLSTDERFCSNAVFSIVQLALTDFRAIGYDNVTGEFNQQVTDAVRQIMVRMDTLNDYTQKFTKKPTIRQFVETALREVAISGAVAAELVINKAGIPDYMQAVAYESLTYKTKTGNLVYPKQKPASGGGDDIELDIANFFICELNLGADETYATPMYKSALIDTFQNNDFVDSMRRVVNRTGHSRLVISLDAEKVKASASEEVQQDESKMMTYMAQVQKQVQQSVSQLNPEDSVVVYDSMSVDVADIGGAKSDYVPLMQQVNNMQATSLKAPPSILGIRSEGSQSLANSETLVYLKIAKSIQGPVIDLLSRALTLAVRLLGVPGYVKFDMDPIELRPDSEREAYKMTKQQRILNQLSLGLISDEDACLQLGVPFRTEMAPLSGTRFLDKGAETSKADDKPDNSGGMEQNLSPDTPDKAGGESQ
ncbi:portal protein [Vibrio phage K45]